MARNKQSKREGEGPIGDQSLHANLRRQPRPRQDGRKPLYAQVKGPLEEGNKKQFLMNKFQPMQKFHKRDLQHD